MSLVLVKKIVETYFLFLIGNIKLFEMYSIHKKKRKKAYMIPISSVVEVEARPEKPGVSSSSISMISVL
jgi:hypothetical protein